jgi:flagellar hook assembly protein FlgD
MGRITRQLAHGRQRAGWHQATWDGRNDLGSSVTSGVYFVVLNAAGKVETRKLIVTR